MSGIASAGDVTDEPPISPISPMGKTFGHDPRTYAIIGAAQRVHRELGPGFLERAYEEALCIELAERGVPHESQVKLGILYRGRLLDARYRADVVAFGEVLIELKAHAGVGPVDEAQLLHYLKASGLRTGLLLNFGASSLQVRRLAHGRPTESVTSVQSVVRGGGAREVTAGRAGPAPRWIPTSGTSPAPSGSTPSG